jgi:glycosyltransferase involved in cell wall biosynthesis
METLAAGVWRSIRKVRPDAILIAHGGKNRALIWWLPIALLRVFVRAARNEIQFVLAGDALTNAAVSFILRPFGVPCITMVMGLDVTYPNRLYRVTTRRGLKRTRLVIAISAATAEEVRKIGVPTSRIVVMRLGVPIPSVGEKDRAAARTSFHHRLGIPDREIVLATIGRLVARKGVGWFVQTVLPMLPPTVHYVVAGEGPEFARIKQAAVAAGVSRRVRLLGRIDDERREEILRGADLFVQPNVPVVADMEGFGLVTIEAALRGTLVVAADLEGVRDAVVDGRTGLLLPPGDAEAWSQKLIGLLANPEQMVEMGASFGRSASELYGEERMGATLCGILHLDERPKLVSDGGVSG